MTISEIKLLRSRGGGRMDWNVESCDWHILGCSAEKVTHYRSLSMKICFAIFPITQFGMSLRHPEWISPFSTKKNADSSVFMRSKACAEKYKEWWKSHLCASSYVWTSSIFPSIRLTQPDQKSYPSNIAAMFCSYQNTFVYTFNMKWKYFKTFPKTFDDFLNGAICIM